MVAEHGCDRPWQAPQEETSEKICEQIVEVHVPQVVGQVLEVPKTASRDRTLQETVERVVDVPVPEMVEQLVKLPKTVSEDGMQERTMEQTVDILVPRYVEEPTEFFKASSLDRVQQSSAEQTIETLAIFFVGKIFEVPVIQTQRKTQQGVNAHVQHAVVTVEVEKHIIQGNINQVTKDIGLPPLQITDKVVDIPVVAQRQAHMIQTVKETIEIPQCNTLIR